MSDIKEVDALADFRLTLDHFYTIVKEQVGNLQADQYIQLQATAVPLDVSQKYEWFSRSNLSGFFDVRIDPTPVAENVTDKTPDLLLRAGARYSTAYEQFLAELLSLVEIKELDGATLKRIDDLTTRINNNGSRINGLLDQRFDDWQRYARASMIQPGDLYAFQHWLQGHHTTRAIVDLSQEQARDQSMIQALRLRQYADPDHQAVVDAWAAVTAPAARMRFPRYEDGTYLEEAKKFSPYYFAKLDDNDSNLFINRQLMTSRTALATIETGNVGAFSETITRQSMANSRITTDWSVSGRGGWGPFRMSAKASSHEQIREDFSHTQAITVGAKSLQAIPFDATWFDAAMLEHPLAVRNRRMFERFLGQQGTIRYQPTHLLVARGMNLKFTSVQDWSYDYESDFSASGSGSARIFGVGWGGGGSYSRSKREQKVERRGHDLVLDDGENLRIIGYQVSEATAFENSLLASYSLDGAFR